MFLIKSQKIGQAVEIPCAKVYYSPYWTIVLNDMTLFLIIPAINEKKGCLLLKIQIIRFKRSNASLISSGKD